MRAIEAKMKNFKASQKEMDMNQILEFEDSNTDESEFVGVVVLNHFEINSVSLDRLEIMIHQLISEAKGTFPVKTLSSNHLILANYQKRALQVSAGACSSCVAHLSKGITRTWARILNRPSNDSGKDFPSFQIFSKTRPLFCCLRSKMMDSRQFPENRCTKTISGYSLRSKVISTSCIIILILRKIH